MSFKNLGAFLDFLEKGQQLVRVSHPVSTQLEVTEIHRRVLSKQGPALLFENPIQMQGNISSIPLLTNLFGTCERIGSGITCNGKSYRGKDELRQLGHLLAALRMPKPPKNWKDILELWPVVKMASKMRPCYVKRPSIDEVILEGDDIDLLNLFPIQGCWPGEPAPLITWPLVVTRGADNVLNIGIYRMQCLEKNKTLMRWLAHRGGAKHFFSWQKTHPDAPFPVAVAIGADPGTLLACVTPVPETLSEYHFAGLLRGQRLELTPCSHDPSLFVPAHAEIVLEGFIAPHTTRMEGPYGDHTGYYNTVEPFPVFEVTKVRMRQNPVYLSTYTGRPPDEPAILGEALNEVFVPLLQQQFPEIVDFYLPPEGCSYRIATVSIRKCYAGHAKRVMMGIWSFLQQFMYTKWIIVLDDDINIRDWKDVMWAISTRADPVRDLTLVDNTPIDYLDFASPHDGLGGKIGIDATNKVPPETTREWGKKLDMCPQVIARVDEMWSALGIL